MIKIVIGSVGDGVDSQIRILLEGIDRRYKKLYIKVPVDTTDPARTKTIVAPLFSPNRSREIEVGTHLTFQVLARANFMSSDNNTIIKDFTLQR